ncbi:hypothetical protein HNQ78_002310 [Phycisphaera mikurensis]|nr:hypothetical protein [Phycisphaera mikurensis]
MHLPPLRELSGSALLLAAGVSGLLVTPAGDPRPEAARPEPQHAPEPDPVPDSRPERHAEPA